MTVIQPTITGATSDINSSPTSFRHSTFVVKGAPRPVSNGIDAKVWVPKDSVLPEEDSIYKEVSLMPTYSGELFWSAATGTYPNLVITENSAQLYISVHHSLVPAALAQPFRNEYYWVPVILDSVTSYLDPATGKDWDPVGLYVCNPPYLCVDS